jgi:kynurenine formamidase
MRVVDEVIDLTMPFYEGMPCDDLGPKVWERLGHAYSRQLYQRSQSRAGRVFLTTDHTGTHLDGPLRFDPKGAPVEKIPLESFIRPARMLDLRGLGRAGLIDAAALEAAGGGKIRAGDAAVLWTGHDLYMKDADYFWHRPQLSEDGAEYLAGRKAGIVAADFPGIGRPSDDRYEIKRMLHRAGCMTVEQLRNLRKAANEPWHLFCAPLRIRGGAGSIIRACALVNWRASRVIDMTQEFFLGMPTLGAEPTFWTRANHKLTSTFYGGELSYQTHSLFLTEHAGTHFDVPYHFNEHGRAIDDYSPDELLVPAKLLDLTHKKAMEPMGADDFEAAARRGNVSILPGDGIVVWTGHDKNYLTRKDFCGHRQFITADGAKWLAEHRPQMVITDLVGLDEPADLTTPVHNVLLHNDVCILQVTANLGEMAHGAWYVAAFPINLVGGTGSPTRAFAART